MNTRERGVLLVELALVFPFLAGMFLFAVSASSFIQADQRISSMTREAANIALRDCALDPAMAADCLADVREEVLLRGNFVFDNEADFDVSISFYDCPSFSCDAGGNCSCAGGARLRSRAEASGGGLRGMGVSDEESNDGMEELCIDLNLCPDGFGRENEQTVGRGVQGRSAGSNQSSPVIAATTYDVATVSTLFSEILDRRGFVVIAEGVARSTFGASGLGFDEARARVLF